MAKKLWMQLYDEGAFRLLDYLPTTLHALLERVAAHRPCEFTFMEPLPKSTVGNVLRRKLQNL